MPTYIPLFKKLIPSAMLAAGLLLTPVVSHAALSNLPDFTRLVETQGRAVVNISARQTARTPAPRTGNGVVPDELLNDPLFSEFFRRFAPQQQAPQQQTPPQRSLGSGFVLSSDGYIMTNAHVVGKADDITVSTPDKREFKAKLVGADTRTDVALLKIEGANLPAVTVGNPALLKAGEWVVAIGAPFGFDNSVTAGIVSAKGRQLPGDAYVPFIQTDVAVNPGNSGGPLFNLDGQVVGINSQIYSRSGGFMGISFAIPIDVAMQVAEQLKTKGRVSRAMIGVSVQEVSRDLATSFGLPRPAGALVSAVEPNGAADRAGLKAGDIILKVGGHAVETAGDLARLIGGARVGEPLPLDIWRNKAPRTLTAHPTEVKDPGQAAARTPNAGAPATPLVLKRLGLLLAPINPAQLQRAGLRFGLAVQRVEGNAARAGVQPGDVLIGLGNETLASAEVLVERVSTARTGETLALKMLRGNVVLFVPVLVGEGN